MNPIRSRSPWQLIASANQMQAATLPCSPCGCVTPTQAPEHMSLRVSRWQRRLFVPVLHENCVFPNRASSSSSSNSLWSGLRPWIRGVVGEHLAEQSRSAREESHPESPLRPPNVLLTSAQGGKGRVCELVSQRYQSDIHFA